MQHLFYFNAHEITLCISTSTLSCGRPNVTLPFDVYFWSELTVLVLVLSNSGLGLGLGLASAGLGLGICLKS